MREYRNDHDLWLRMLRGKINEAVFLDGLYDRAFYAELWERVKRDRRDKRRKKGKSIVDDY